MIRALALRSIGRGRPSPKTFSRRGRRWAGRVAAKDMASPFGSKQPAGRPETIETRLRRCQKKGLQRFRFSGSIRTARYLNSPLVGTPTPPLPAGFVFLGLRFSVQLIESTRRIAPRKRES